MPSPVISLPRLPRIGSVLLLAGLAGGLVGCDDDARGAGAEKVVLGGLLSLTGNVPTGAG